MIRLDIFWSLGQPPSWGKMTQAFHIFVISIGASNLYIEAPKKLDLPIFGWKNADYMLQMYTNISIDTNISVIYIYVYKYTYGTHERTIHIYQFRYAYNTFSGTLLKYLTSPDITWQAVALAAVRQNGLALQCLDETSLGSTRSQMFPIGLWYIYI